MKSSIIVGCIFGLIGIAALVAAQDQPKAAILYTVTADQLANEFKNDPAAAAKKYDPTPPQGKLGGAIIGISGEVASVQGKEVTLKTSAGVTIILRAKELKGANAGRLQAKAEGKLADYKRLRKVIVINCDTVELARIIGN